MQVEQHRIGKFGVSRGIIVNALRVFLYGTPGVGKTSFAAAWPRPLFLCAEAGAGEIDVARVVFDETGRLVPNQWTEVFDAIDSLLTEPHDFSTLVVDGLDALDSIARKHVLAENPRWKSISDAGYGKGEEAVLDAWRVLISRLEDLWSRRTMHVVLIGHSKIKRFDNPQGEAFDRYQPSLTEKVAGPLQAWVDVQGFAEFIAHTVKGEDKRVRGVGTGARVLHVHRMPAWEAKCRPCGVPVSMPLSYEDFERAVKDGQSPAKLREELVSLLEHVDDKTRAKVSDWLTTSTANNPQKLAEAVDRLRGKVMISEGEKQ